MYYYSFEDEDFFLGTYRDSLASRAILSLKYCLMLVVISRLSLGIGIYV